MGIDRDFHFAPRHLGAYTNWLIGRTSLQSRRERTIPQRAALDASGRARRATASLSSLRSSRYRARTLVLALA
jgi:hypothetical protein